MPLNQINQICQLSRVCWNHFSFFFHHFFLILIQPTSKRYDHYKYQFLWAFEWCMSRGHLRLYTEILSLQDVQWA